MMDPITFILIVVTVVVAAGVVVLFAYLLVIRPWYLRWGATDADVRRSLPGDDLVSHPKMASTRAIAVRAPAAKVWPWLAQIGHKRAGWYSYDLMHRILRVAGSVDDDRRSARRIVPELQHPKVGESIEIGPGMGYKIATVELNQALVLHTGLEMGTWQPFDPTGPTPEKYLNSSWVWFLDEVDERTTRLIVRERHDYNPSLLNVLMMRGLIEPGSFVMERRTLLNIKRRVEAAAGQRGER